MKGSPVNVSHNKIIDTILCFIIFFLFVCLLFGLGVGVCAVDGALPFTLELAINCEEVGGSQRGITLNIFLDF